MSTKKYVYLFEEGNAGMKNLLGGKGANLAEMTNIGLPVPPGLIVTTEACKDFTAQDQQFPAGLEEQIQQGIARLEEKTGKRFGDEANPLLLSVRSGAPVSMPGMMDTVLNLGLNDRTTEALASATGDERFALDCYRRFINMFGDVVMGVEHHKFESILANHKEKVQIKLDNQLSAGDWREIIAEYKKLVQKETGRLFPQEPMEQLFMAVRAVFNSWNNDRAIVYRKINKIPDDLGTAVNIQVMVFGNLGNDSGTGVAFTRNPSTGENKIYGEYLINAQGEDVVAGIRTPQPIDLLQQDMPEIYNQFAEVCGLLTRHYRDMQDIEFTVERGKLWILQTRSGKRTAQAAIKIAVDMVEEGLITREEAVLRVEPGQLDQLLHRRINSGAKLNIIARGLPASPGAASGMVVFDADEAERLNAEGKKIILVRVETTPDDIHGIVGSQGVLTSRGGMTSHAAVVARGMGKPCVCGCESISIDYEKNVFSVGDLVVRKGDTISIDGSTGNVILGEVPMLDPELSPEFKQLLEWADQLRTLGVRANADTPQDAAKSREFGAEGIGLTRTEHMFMAQDRLPIVQEMILSADKAERQAALDKLLPMQQGDFYGILKAMDGLPVTIRLLDPPLHEFLPNAEELLVEITRLRLTNGSKAEIEKKEELLRKVRGLSELNPMLGHRGCRLGITFPEIYAMQARAIFLATAQLVKEGFNPIPEVEIPLVIDLNELSFLRQIVVAEAEKVVKETGISFHYTVGTMIEIPRAALLADELAQAADFFSFGTNDLTQTTLGFSRDDAEGKFIQVYQEKKILPENPFMVLDRKGVGKLMKWTVEQGRKTTPDLLIGICGEHGGEPSSIEFCQEIGLDYVSCSPFRVPIARLAAAQAAVNNKNRMKEGLK
ncbi:MAG TPA: pyruvate, phosphate dikinase [Bacillota bacterium]|jgi:pyruvate,orthophosphate dikinase|nr:pyruvate, phosphate dikinase [Peptococcaceae bacterium MAG4]NLW37385.1 pyruvate, phosphate dikinase [Peptococcaceae bacterium]HPZ44354.1 pyruvate, phosphate dikinase [Bacillota bacterium]HQD76968.1 pyruvate, phosphate dikinase [Bacillota bacterium]HUM59671.1 pyruvate, phosphate dikinase [Bacillota bacterium]